MGEEVRVPVGRGTARAAAQLRRARGTAEEDLRAACPAGAAAQRRDVDDPFPGARSGSDLDGSTDVVGQGRVPCSVARPGPAHAVSA